MEYSLEFISYETQTKDVRGLTCNREDLEMFDFFCLFCVFVFCLTELYLFSKGPAKKSRYLSGNTELRGEKSRLEPYSHNVPGNMFSIRSQTTSLSF